jgi:hypothetical protein
VVRGLRLHVDDDGELGSRMVIHVVHQGMGARDRDDVIDDCLCAANALAI